MGRSYKASSGLQTAKTFADGNSTSYTYRPDGKLLTRTWARTSGGNPLLATYGYDANTGEQTSIDYSDSTTDITFSYTRAGQQAQITDAAGTRIFAYNTELQPIAETISGLYSRTITRSYAASGVVGRYTGFGVDSGHGKAVGYDNLGRLNTVARGSDAFAYSFVANSNLVANIAKPGNLSTAFGYEANRDLITAVDNKYNATTVSNYGYVNDALYRRASMSRSGSAFAVADTIGYSYNDRSEVIGAVSDNVQSYAYGYDFDNIGNRLTASLSGANWTYNANNLNQYSSVFDGVDTQTPGYNPDGCMTSYGDWTYTWNAENRLAEAVSADAKLEFAYDYTGRRVVKKVYSGSEVGGWTLNKHLKFVYDGFKLIEELDGNDNDAVLRQYIWDDETLLSVTDAAVNETYYYFADANKNIGQVVESAGTIQAKYEYSPFGKTVSLSGSYAETNPFRFSSEYYDSETGLAYYNYRYYSPVLGRWLSRDPIEEQGGYNLYGFIDNDGVNNWDELRLFFGWAYRKYVAPMQRNIADRATNFIRDYLGNGTASAFGAVAETGISFTENLAGLDPSIAIPAMGNSLRDNFNQALDVCPYCSSGSGGHGVGDYLSAGYYASQMSLNPLTPFMQGWDGRSYQGGQDFGRQLNGLERAGQIANGIGGTAATVAGGLTLTQAVRSTMAAGGTETVQRWMSRAELDATGRTGLLRGGRNGTHYVTDAANSSAIRARQRLALDHTPEVRVKMQVPANRFSSPSTVQPLVENGRVTMPGGGMERTATGNIPVKILKTH